MAAIVNPERPCPAARCVSAVLILLISLQSCLSGCSKDNNPQEPSPGPGPQSVSVAGAVDTAEIGGDDLKMISSWEDPVTVREDGGFSIDVSGTSSQLVFAVDGDDSLRAMALAVPHLTSADSAGLLVDSRSTAMSLVMMTPGILTLESEKAAERIGEIQELAEFDSLASLVSRKCAADCLPAVLRNPAVGDALDRCISSWIDTHEEEGQISIIMNGTESSDCSKFGAWWTDSIPRSQVAVQIANQSWRYITVFRRLIDEHGDPLSPGPYNYFNTSMPGAVPVSWHSIFTGKMADPTYWFDSVDFTCSSRAADAEYWAVGWGMDKGADLPEGIFESNQARRDRILSSVLGYIVLPLIGLFVGFIPNNPQGTGMSELINHIWSVPQLSQDVGTSIDRLADAGDMETFGQELATVVSILIGFAVFNSTFLTMINVPAATITFLAWIALGFNMVFTNTNLSMVTVSWSRVPKNCLSNVESPWKDQPCDDTTAPGTVSDLRVVDITGSSVTLSWTAPGDDGMSGNASFTDLRYDTTAIDSQSWQQAMRCQDEPPPPCAGEKATLPVGGLSPETHYFFALRTGDEIPNWSGISNCVDTTTAALSKQEAWDLSFQVTGCTKEQFSCSPQGCYCPPEWSVYGFCPDRTLNVWGIAMEKSGSSYHGDMNLEDVYIGSYILRTGTLEVAAIEEDGLISYDLSITGMLDDPFLTSEQNPFAELDCSFSVSDAVRQNNSITGGFTFVYIVDSLEESCMDLFYSEEGVGNSSVDIRYEYEGKPELRVSSQNK